ncbi:MAG: DmsC/YnfH family molybdoenzyme membrane anchor subunit [Burkholderiaceae bacterium]
MNPAISVVLLTTLIGAAQGLILALCTVEVHSLLGLASRPDEHFYVNGALVALGLLVAGLAASFFHLGRPERAWRAASQWRTSWLSREVIALPALMVAIAAYAASHLPGLQVGLFALPGGATVQLSTLVGAIAALLCVVLFVCTGMIYACLRFLAEWRTPLTVVNYALIGASSGFVLAAALAQALDNGLAHYFAAWALAITVCALISRVSSLVRNARLRPLSTLQTAIGVKHPRIVQITMGFMGGSFNTREFFHGLSKAAMRSLRSTFVVFGFLVPMGLLVAGLLGAGDKLFIVAFVVQYVGLLIERWYFFAEANHPQNLYYRAIG